MANEIKYREIAKFLRSIGWTPIRQRGSHETWADPHGKTLTIAQHGGVVSKGIVRQINKTIPNTPKNWK